MNGLCEVRRARSPATMPKKSGEKEKAKKFRRSGFTLANSEIAELQADRPKLSPKAITGVDRYSPR